MFRYRLLIATIALAVTGAMTFAVAAPAEARILPPHDLIDYMLTLPGQMLYAQNTPGAKAAWAGNMEAYSAQSAGRYSAAAVLGNVTPQKVAGVIPINSVRNPDLPKTSRWSAIKDAGKRGFAIPFTGTQPGYKPKVGAGGAIMAATAYAFRGEIASGVLGMFGIDAHGAVCGFEGSSSGVVNFLTGQDCSMYEQAREFDPNEGELIGSFGDMICNHNESRCVQLEGVVSYYHDTGAAAYDAMRYCFGTGTEYVAGYFNSLRFFDTQGNLLDLRMVGPGRGGTAGNYCADGQWDIGVNDNLSFQYLPDLFTSYGFSSSQRAAIQNYDGNPTRWIECKIHWSSGHIDTAVSSTFTEADGAYPAPVCPDAPAGAHPQRQILTVVGLGIEPYTYFDQTVTPEYDEFIIENDDCLEFACFLDVVIIESGLSCFSSTVTESCADWFHDPDRDTKYRCEYGGRTNPMQSCFVYANLFNADKRAAGLAYVDPLTGEEVPGTTTSTRADEWAMQNPIRPGGAGETRSCWGGSWSWNPVDWVLRPIQCAAEWAFVPRPAAVEQTTYEIEQSWHRTTIARSVIAIGGAAMAFESLGEGGCGGIPISLGGIAPDIVNLGEHRILAACSGDYFESWAQLCKLFLGGGILWTGFLSVKAQISRFVGNGDA